MAKKSRMQTLKDWMVIAFCLVGVVFMVVAAANQLSELLSRPLANHLPPVSELATLFSGASSLALTIFSLLLAFAAIVGWQSIRQDIETVRGGAEAILKETERSSRLGLKRLKRMQTKLLKRGQTLEADMVDRITALQTDMIRGVAEVENDMTKRVTELERNMVRKNNEIETELRGRVTALMGNLLGTLHSNPTADYQREEDEPYIAEAIYHSRIAYDYLSKLPGNKKYMPLQNLVYYSSLLKVQIGKEELLQQARELRDVARNYSEASVPYLVTYSRAVLTFSSDRAEVEDALITVRNVLHLSLTKLAAMEARFVEVSLSAKLTSLASGGGGS
jgi:hypothetical protein